MKKNLLFSFITGILFLVSCSLVSHHRTQKKTHQSPSKPLLLGWLNQQQIFNQFPGYQQEKDQYQPDSDYVEKLKKSTTGVKVIVFFGTWCSDSQREVPRFLKIMELAQNPGITVKLFGLDRSKRDEGGLAESYQVEFVPTFVVLHNEQEIGRIVETPIMSLEQDLVEILAPLR